jgi:hypothetical protein
VLQNKTAKPVNSVQFPPQGLGCQNEAVFFLTEYIIPGIAANEQAGYKKFFMGTGVHTFGLA